jgi:hypothetical protein
MAYCYYNKNYKYYAADVKTIKGAYIFPSPKGTSIPADGSYIVGQKMM